MIAPIITLKSQGESWPPWVAPRLVQKGRPKQPPALQTHTIFTQKYDILNLKDMWADSVPTQYLEATPSVQHVVGFLQIQEDHK